MVFAIHQHDESFLSQRGAEFRKGRTPDKHIPFLRRQNVLEKSEQSSWFCKSPNVQSVSVVEEEQMAKRTHFSKSCSPNHLLCDSEEGGRKGLTIRIQVPLVVQQDF